MENRKHPPAAAPAGLTWEKRLECIEPDFMYKIFGYIQARCLDLKEKDEDEGDTSDSEEEEECTDLGGARPRQARTSFGPLFVRVQWILRRAVRLEGGAWGIRVVRWTKPGALGELRRRGYSGTGVFPTVPPVGVQQWLDGELAKGIPRTYMGRSLFGECKIVKAIGRWGLGARVNDVDMCVARCFAKRDIRSQTPTPLPGSGEGRLDGHGSEYRSQP